VVLEHGQETPAFDRRRHYQECLPPRRTLILPWKARFRAPLWTIALMAKALKHDDDGEAESGRRFGVVADEAVMRGIRLGYMRLTKQKQIFTTIGYLWQYWHTFWHAI
jgi:hypothetical protein